MKETRRPDNLSRVNGSDFIVHDKIVFLEFLQRLCDINTSRDVKPMSERVNMISRLHAAQRKIQQQTARRQIKKKPLRILFSCALSSYFQSPLHFLSQNDAWRFQKPGRRRWGTHHAGSFLRWASAMRRCYTHTHTHYRYVDFTVHGQLLELKTDMCYIFSYLGITVDDLGYYGSWSTPGVSVCVCVHCRSSAKATTSNA